MNEQLSRSALESDEQIENARASLSGDAWLLIAGIVLFVAGCFLPSKTLGEIVRVLDLRHWPFWYYPLASLVAVFAIFWIRFYCNWDNFSDDQRRTARWFIRLSVFCAVVIVAVFIIHVGKFYLPLREPLYFWFVAGSFSLTAALTLLTVLGAAGIIVWLLIEWISSMRN